MGNTVQYAVQGVSGFIRFIPKDGRENGEVNAEEMKDIRQATLFDSVSDAAFLIARRAATSQVPTRNFKIVPVYTETVTTLKAGEPV